MKLILVFVFQGKLDPIQEQNKIYFIIFLMITILALVLIVAALSKILKFRYFTHMQIKQDFLEIRYCY